LPRTLAIKAISKFAGLAKHSVSKDELTSLVDAANQELSDPTLTLDDVRDALVRLENLPDVADLDSTFERQRKKLVGTATYRLVELLKLQSSSQFEPSITAVRKKKRGLTILRFLETEIRTVPQIQEEAKLSLSEVTEILHLTESVGLTSRSTFRRSERWGITSLGLRTLELMQEFPWIRQAQTMIRACVRARLLGEPMDTTAARTAELLGCSVESIKYSLKIISDSVDPTISSNLAKSLVPIGSTIPIVLCPTVYPKQIEREQLVKERTDIRHAKPWTRNEGLYAPRPDTRGEAFVRRALQRAGLDVDAVEEWLPQKYLELCSTAIRPVNLPTNRTIISISSPMVNPVTLALLIRYGSPVYFDHQVSSCITYEKVDQKKSRTRYPLNKDRDFGMMIRFFDTATRLSQFVLAGMKPSGTYAACRYFQANIEKLLEQYPEQSFAAILGVRRGYPPEKAPYLARPVAVFDVSSDVDDEVIDMRFIDALPLMAESYLSDPKYKPLLAEVVENLDLGTVDSEELLKRIDRFDKDPITTYAMARDLAVILTKEGRFEEFLILLLAGWASRTTPLELLNNKKQIIEEVLGKLHLASYTQQALLRLLKIKKWRDLFLQEYRHPQVGSRQREHHLTP
jgi:hypothetical protein